MIETDRKKIVRRLKKDGWTLRHGGSHDIYYHADFPDIIITVPRHRTISTGVARVIAKNAKWI